MTADGQKFKFVTGGFEAVHASLQRQHVPRPLLAEVVTNEVDEGADPLLTRGVLQAFDEMYLQEQDAAEPKASALHAHLHDLPPIRNDVGDNDVLLADSIRYADRPQAAGVEITVSVWKAMPHVFRPSLGKLVAAERCVNAIGEFLRQRLVGTSPSISTPLKA